MMPGDVRTASDVPALLEDADGYAAVKEGFHGMFEREVFDLVICGSEPMARIARDMGWTICSVDLPEGDFKGRKAVLISDVLRDGIPEMDLIKQAESKGLSVIKLGFVLEDSSAGARKSRIFRKYPFETLLYV
jgi:hypothetical protein